MSSCNSGDHIAEGHILADVTYIIGLGTVSNRLLGGGVGA